MPLSSFTCTIFLSATISAFKPVVMRSRTATRDHEMNWLLWEASDTKMMLVKKTKAKRKAPRSPSTGDPPSPPSPPSFCAEQSAVLNNTQQLYSTRAHTTLALPAYEPPPPYSHPPVPPKDTYHKSSLATQQPPAPPPRPPKIPLPPVHAPKSPWTLRRSRKVTSCTDLSKAAANAVDPTCYNAKHYDEKSMAPNGPPRGLEDLISSKLDAVLTSIDGESFSGNEQELGISLSAPQLSTIC